MTDMNHKKHYDLLVKKAQQRPKLSGYVEKHHIVPKSLGGSDDATNLVEFTAREHCLAHLLLAHIYNHHKMWFAANMMSRLYKTKSRAYEKVRIKNSEIMRERMASSSNPMLNEAVKVKHQTAIKLAMQRPEVRKRQSEVRIGMKFSDSHKENLSKAHIGVCARGESSSAKRIKFEGKIFDCIMDLADHVGVNHKTMYTRLSRNPQRWGYEVLK